MFLPSNDGISCDFCGIILKNKFIYYSLRSTEYRIINNMKMLGKDPKFNKDMCDSCYDQTVADIMKHIGKYKPGHIKDDLSKDYFTGTFNYWYIILDKIEINKDLPSDNQVDIEKHVLDLNVVKFKELKDRTEKVENTLKISGGWS